MSDIEVPKHKNDKKLPRRAILGIMIATSVFLIAIWFFRTQPPLSRGDIAANFPVIPNYIWLNSHEFIVGDSISGCWGPTNMTAETNYRYDAKIHSKVMLASYKLQIEQNIGIRVPIPLSDALSPDGKWLFYTVIPRKVKNRKLMFESKLVSTAGFTKYKLKVLDRAEHIFWKPDSSAFLIASPFRQSTEKNLRSCEMRLYSVSSPSRRKTLKERIDLSNASILGYLENGSLAVKTQFNEHTRIVLRNGKTGSIDMNLPTVNSPDLQFFKPSASKEVDFSVISEMLSPDGKYLTTGYLKSNLNKINLPEPLASFFPCQRLHLWLVKTDGSGWIDLGETTARSYIDAGTLKWLPDSNHISVVKDDKLWVFPIR